MGNRYAGEGDAGPVEAFRDGGRETHMDVDEETGEVTAGWTFPNLTDPVPDERSRQSLHWRVAVYVTVDALNYAEAVSLLAERMEQAGIPYELE